MEGCNLQDGSEPALVHERATEVGINHLWLVGGGVLASSFIQAGLLTHIEYSLDV